MKSFVVMTFYQLMHATAMTLELKEKTNLYFVYNYLRVPDSILEKIRDTGLFNTVVKLDQEENMGPFHAEMDKTEGLSADEIDKIGDSLFEKYLEPYYARKFANADFEDEIYVYNDFQKPFYYIAKHFKHIVGVEDGYGSFSQQLKVHSFNTKKSFAQLKPFVGKYYPEPLFKEKNVEKIISSCSFDDLPEYYQNKLCVVDFKQLVGKNKSKFIKAMKTIFDLNDIKIESGGILILTSPLSRVNYCNATENFLLFRKLVNTEKKRGKKIYIKPHPADSMIDYKLLEDDQVTVLPRQFPIELMEFENISFSKSISFGSSAVVDQLCDNNEYLYNGDKNPSSIKKFIQDYIENETVNINVYIKLTGMSPDRYINAYGYLKKLDRIHVKIILLTDSKNKEYKKYYSLDNISKRISSFTKLQKSQGKIAFVSEARKMNINSLRKRDYCFTETDSMDDFDIYRNIIKDDQCDYFLLVDDLNPGVKLITNIKSYFTRKIRFCYTFINYTYSGTESEQENRIILSGGQVGKAFSNQLSNRLWHSSFDRLIDLESKVPVSDVLYSRFDSVTHRSGILLHSDNKKYLSIENGCEHYNNLLNELTAEEKSDDELARNVAVLMREYYEWASVVSPRSVKDLLKQFIVESNLREEIKVEVESEFIEQLLKERTSEYNREIYNELDNFNYYNKLVKKKIKDGTFEKDISQTGGIKTKLKNSVKSIIRKK